MSQVKPSVRPPASWSWLDDGSVKNDVADEHALPVLPAIRPQARLQYWRPGESPVTGSGKVTMRPLEGVWGGTGPRSGVCEPAAVPRSALLRAYSKCTYAVSSSVLPDPRRLADVWPMSLAPALFNTQPLSAGSASRATATAMRTGHIGRSYARPRPMGSAQ